MEAKIRIEMDNAAFYTNDGAPDGGAELGRILRDLAERVEQGGAAAAEERYPVADLNGNVVGFMEIAE